jgi:EAL and modified HD-GYP domain-containing signal transduction protein
MATDELTHQVTAETVQAPALEHPGALRYVARQPVMDRRNRVHGYELLFRAGPEAVFRGNGDLATRTMLDNTVMLGLERLTGGLPAFLNCTRESLTEDLVSVLPSSMTVLEILEDLAPTPRLIEACRSLKSAGFRIALDDFTWKPDLEPLVAMADYIKVDFRLSNAEERFQLLQRLRGFTLALVAEKVETEDEYKRACDEGFTLFQGYYFCRPVLLKSGKVPANHSHHVQILKMLRDDSLELRKLTSLVKQDASLTYRLLRLVNSPMCAVRQEVRSIRSALLAVGEDTFRKLATLAITSELSQGQPEELLRVAFVRGRFCELVAELCGRDSTEQYLLGMLSLLDAMLKTPMAELIPHLPLRSEIHNALLHKANDESTPLEWLEFHEQGNWAGCDAKAQKLRLDEEILVEAYADAVVWAEDALRSTL